jgi:ATP-dependent Zn protease
LLTEANDTALRMLTERGTELDKIAAALLEKEMIGREEMGELVGPRPVTSREVAGKSDE